MFAPQELVESGLGDDGTTEFKLGARVAQIELEDVQS